MTDPNFYFSHEFYKAYIAKLQALNSIVLDQFYLQTFVALTNKSTRDCAKIGVVQSKYCSYIQRKKRQLAHTSNEQLLKSYRSNLNECKEFIDEDRASFLAEIDQLICKSYHLRNIAKSLVRIDSIVVRYVEILSNIENLRRSIHQSDIKSHLEAHYDRVFGTIRLHFPSTIEMGEAGSAGSGQSSSVSSLTFQTLLNEAVAHKKQTMPRVASREIHELGLEMFRSDDSLGTKTRLGMGNIEEKVHTFKAQMKSIDALEQNISDMQTEMSKMSVATKLAKEQLNKKKQDMSDVLEDLVRLNRLLEMINQDILRQINDGKALIEAEEKELERTLNDPNLTEEERKAKLDELNRKIAVLKLKQQAALEHLNTKKIELNHEIQGNMNRQAEGLEQIGKSPSKYLQTDDGIKARQESSQKQEHIKELLKSKVGKSPSECLRIDEEIKARQESSQKQEQIEELRKAKLGKSPSECLRIDEQIKVLQNALETNNVLNDQSIERTAPDKQMCDETSSSSECRSTCALTNFEYAKEHMGRALRLALAETVLHQPKDPINFIANHLLMQRHSALRKQVQCIREETTHMAREAVRKLSEKTNVGENDFLCNPCMQFE